MILDDSCNQDKFSRYLVGCYFYKALISSSLLFCRLSVACRCRHSDALLPPPLLLCCCRSLQMDKSEDSGSPGWGASSLMQTTEDVARAFFAAASAATARSTRPSVVFSSNDENTSTQLQKLQHKITSVFRGNSLNRHETRGTYNPEVLTSQKRQWTRFQLQSLKYMKEPSKVFESMVVVGLHPNTDFQVLQKIVLENGNEDPKKSRGLLSYNHQIHADPNLEPQVLFVYPPEKQLPLKCEDLLSFCFPGGVEVHAVERTPSLSELNEILLGQEQLKQSNQSFVFRLQVADNSTLYGCCILVDEIVQKPSKLVSMLMEEKVCSLPLSHRHIMTTSRCYCILSRLPFFDLHFGILRSIFIEERLERLTKGIHMLNLLSPEEAVKTNGHVGTDIPISENHSVEDAPSSRSHFDTTPEVSPEKAIEKEHSVDNQLHEVDLDTKEGSQHIFIAEATRVPGEVVTEVVPKLSIQNIHGNHIHEVDGNTQPDKKGICAALPLLQCRLHESSEASSSFQGFPCEDGTFRSEIDEDGMDEPSSSDKKDSDHHDVVLEWAKAHSHGSLQLICEYYKLKCPARGSTLMFHPLEHLHPLEFHRPSETTLHSAGSTVDLRSFGTSIDVAEARNALLSEEEATILSVWTVATLCGCLRLDHVLMMFAGALLEKQIVVVCSNLGILSASVLSVIPLICPYQWQCLLMPVLPNHMLEFLDAPVPYIVGVKNKTADMQTRLGNVIVVDVNKNQVKAPSMPQLPRQKELLSSLSPYHSRLVGESYLARKRPVYECTDVQIEAAKGFLAVLRSYLDSLCSNLRSHTITNVQSNNDKISLLLKESFIDSYSYRERPFMKHFVDTQLFSVHTDLILSFYQKD